MSLRYQELTVFIKFELAGLIVYQCQKLLAKFGNHTDPNEIVPQFDLALNWLRDVSPVCMILHYNFLVQHHCKLYLVVINLAVVVQTPVDL